MSRCYGWSGEPASWVALQLPSRAALGVVLVTPLGQEGVIAYRTLRLIADRLERAGIASARYDPPGRGEGAPSADPQAPIGGARQAAALLREAGCRQVAFLGLASAAVIAAEAAGPGDHLLYWDPPASGKAWLRRQRSLATLTLGPDRIRDGVETLIGLDADADQLAAVAGWRLRFSVGGRTGCLVRADGAVPSALQGCESAEVEAMADFLDRSSIISRMPVAAVQAVVEWLAGVDAGGDADLVAPALAEELRLDDGSVERIAWLGPNRLFAIETVPASADGGEPVMLLHNGAAEHRVGASDYQVTLARALAGDGIRTIRADRRGTGETGEVVPGAADLMFTAAWIADQEALIAAASAPAGRLGVAGMCAGAWLSAYAGPAHPALIAEISPNDYRAQPAQPDQKVAEERAVEEVSTQRRWLRDRFNRWAPARLRVALARSTGGADVLAHLEQVQGRARSAVLIMGDVDQAIFERHHGVEALQHLPVVDVVRVPGGDHSLFSAPMRQLVIAEVRRRAQDVLGASRVPVSPTIS